MVARRVVDGSSFQTLMFSEVLTEEEISKYFMNDTFKVKLNAQVVIKSHRLGRFSSMVSKALVHSLVLF